MKNSLLKRLLAATLAALAISSALVGCQNGDVNSGESSSESSSESESESAGGSEVATNPLYGNYMLPLYGATAIPEIAEGKPLYVSPNGSDDNDGSKDSPFKTPAKALEAVKSLVSAGLTSPVTVYFHAGDYRVTNLDLTNAGGTADCPVVFKAYGDGEVIFNAGATLKNDMFKPVTDQTILNRLSESVRDKVKVIDLAEVGLTADDIGPLYSWGTGSSAKKYNDGTVGNNPEVFLNETRMTLARYPNEDVGYARFNGVLDEGDPDNLVPGITKLGDTELARVKTWATLDDVGIFSFFMYEWSDQACEIKSVDFETGGVQAIHYSKYGYKNDAKYYFYNILEELDIPGEYYIDRENLKLYVYPPEGTESHDALLSLGQEQMISGAVSNFRFDSITFKGVCNDIISLTGDNISVVRSRLIDSYGHGIVLNGYNNLVHSCEVAYLGKMGVYILGGDKSSLTHGNNLVENCYIHHFQEVFRSYNQGLKLDGCGNRAYYNEIAYTGHSAITYNGPEHDFAYNYIHDVCMDTDDAGALYVGGTWTACGTTIRYNLFRDIGKQGTWCPALYWDDGMSEGIICYNIIDNTSGPSIYLNGGHNIKVFNNLVIQENNANYIFYYQAGASYITDNPTFLKNIWSQESIDNKVGPWGELASIPYMEEPWISRYPYLSQIRHDVTEPTDPRCPGNPAFSEITNNIFVGNKGQVEHWLVHELVYEYSTFTNNTPIPRIMGNFPFDDNGYDLREQAIKAYNITDYEPIPWQEIGRYDYKVTGR